MQTYQQVLCIVELPVLVLYYGIVGLQNTTTVLDLSIVLVLALHLRYSRSTKYEYWRQHRAYSSYYRSRQSYRYLASQQIHVLVLVLQNSFEQFAVPTSRYQQLDLLVASMQATTAGRSSQYVVRQLLSLQQIKVLATAVDLASRLSILHILLPVARSSQYHTHSRSGSSCHS